jgi:glycosyltransferase involved in cell wall biosynthesis
LVWSLHDMWAFSGGEHYAGEDRRYEQGYRRDNRPPNETGFDLNRWIWRRKQRVLATLPALTVLCVSEWLAGRARASYLMRDRDVRVLHNGVDIDIFRPFPRIVARQELQLPVEAPLVLFGAVNSLGDRRKGFDLLVAALSELRREGVQLELVVFGHAADDRAALDDLGFPVHALGEIYDAAQLATVYAACDAMVVPSREEAFGQTAIESLACGTPVVAFRIGGLPEIITHEVTGFLAAAFDVRELARGLHAILKMRNGAAGRAMARAARLLVTRHFSAERQARTCARLYEEVLATAEEKRGRAAEPSPPPGDPCLLNEIEKGAT